MARLCAHMCTTGECAQLVETVLDTLEDGFAVVDNRGQLVLANRQAYKLMADTTVEGVQPSTLLESLRAAKLTCEPEDEQRVLEMLASGDDGVHGDGQGEVRCDVRRGASVYRLLFRSIATAQWFGATVNIRDVTDEVRATSALALSQQELGRHMENTPLAVVELDRDLRFSRWSRRCEELLGYGADEVLGRRLDEVPIVHPADAERVHAELAPLLAGEVTRVRVYNRNTARDGREHHMLWYNSALFGTDGALQSLLCLGLDITDKVEAQHLLQQSLIRYRTLFEEAPVGMVMVDALGNILTANARYLEQLGHPASAVVGKSFLDFVHPLHASSNRRAFERLVAGEVESYDMEKIHRTASGAPLQVRVWVSALRGGRQEDLRVGDSGHGDMVQDDSGQGDVFMGMVEDVSAQKKYERTMANRKEWLERELARRDAYLQQALRTADKTRERLQLILSSMADGLFFVNTEGYLAFHNTVAEELLDLKRRKATSLHFTSVLPDEHLVDGLRTAFRDGDAVLPMAFDLERESSQGVVHVLRTRIDRAAGGEGVSMGLVCTLRDVTRERELDAMKTDFLATAAHEFRSPLTVLRGFTELLLTRTDMDEAQQKNILGLAHESTLTLSAPVTPARS